MKTKQQKTTSLTLKLQAALALCALLGAPNIIACQSPEQISCGSFSWTTTCTEQDNSIYAEFSTGASNRYTCETTVGYGYKSCNPNGTTITCSYTINCYYCDGTTSSYPATFSAPEATYDPTPCP